MHTLIHVLGVWTAVSFALALVWCALIQIGDTGRALARWHRNRRRSAAIVGQDYYSPARPRFFR